VIPAFSSRFNAFITASSFSTKNPNCMTLPPRF
jgi:hypothetical protein